MAQIILAILLASATAAILGVRRASRCTSHGAWLMRYPNPTPVTGLQCELVSLGANVRFARPAQPIDATQVLNLSAGVWNAKVLRGRSLSWRATLFRCA
jgi:hypothetical protein